MASEREASFDAVMAVVYEPLQRYLRRRCPADDVDDVLNATLLAVWRRLDDVPVEQPLPWCYGVARRCLANHRRGARRRLRLIRRAEATAPPVPSYRWTEDADVALQHALDRLGELDRDVVRLWAWEHLEPREIAVVLDATPNAITVRLARIRRRLALEMARQDRVSAGHKEPEHHPELEP